jgi:hypothetical protein
VPHGNIGERYGDVAGDTTATGQSGGAGGGVEEYADAVVAGFMHIKANAAEGDAGVLGRGMGE